MKVENLPDGGCIKMVDVTTFPISEKLAGALVYQGPYSLRQARSLQSLYCCSPKPHA